MRPTQIRDYNMGNKGVMVTVQNGKAVIYSAYGQPLRSFCSDAVSAIIVGSSLQVTRANGLTEVYSLDSGQLLRTLGSINRSQNSNNSSSSSSTSNSNNSSSTSYSNNSNNRSSSSKSSVSSKSSSSGNSGCLTGSGCLTALFGGLWKIVKKLVLWFVVFSVITGIIAIIMMLTGKTTNDTPKSPVEKTESVEVPKSPVDTPVSSEKIKTEEITTGENTSVEDVELYEDEPEPEEGIYENLEELPEN
ncbi:MAG: hypothetical protein ACOX0M_10965 [Salinivirgaceae bacterium]